MTAAYLTEPCPLCYGDGHCLTECCNGAFGCPCGGRVIDLGAAVADACPWCDGTAQAAARRGEAIGTLPICDSCKAKLDAMWDKIGDRLIFPPPVVNRADPGGPR